MRSLIKALSILAICSICVLANADSKRNDITFSSIDKTEFIRGIIESKHQTFLITRPHSWGKSANLGKLQKFFAPVRNSLGKEVPAFRRERLQGISNDKISKDRRIIEEYFFQYPIISMTFEPVEIKDREHLRRELTYYIKNLFWTYDFLGDDHGLTNDERDKFGIYDHHNRDILTDDEIIDSLRYLSQILHNHFGKPTLIMINKYDNFVRYWHVNNPNPSEEDRKLLAYIKDITGKMIRSALHNNKHLYKGIVIGVTDVADMRIFDHIPNVSKDSMLNPTFADEFGFDDKEIKALFKSYGLSVTKEDMENIKKHFGGYQLDGQEIYNPAAINYMTRYFKRDGRPAYDFNRLVAIQSNFCPDKRQEELKSLLDGNSRDVIINPKAGYEALNAKDDDFYSLLVFEGFLTYKNLQKLDNGKYKAKVYIPNIEMRNAFRDIYEKHNPDKREDRVIHMHLGSI